MWPSARVGRIPIITMWAPTVGRLLLGVVEAAPQGVLERRQPALAQLGRRHVDLDVELAELGLEVRVGDRLQRLGVLQRRVAALVDQVELDLQPGHRVVGVEARLAQHPGEHVEVAAHLLAVPRAVGPRELLCLDLFAHDPTLGTAGGSRATGWLSAGDPRPAERLAPSAESAARAARRAARRPARPASSPGRPPGTGRPRTRRARRARPARRRTPAAPRRVAEQVVGRAAHHVGPEADVVRRRGRASSAPTAASRSRRSADGASSRASLGVVGHAAAPRGAAPHQVARPTPPRRAPAAGRRCSARERRGPPRATRVGVGGQRSRASSSRERVRDPAVDDRLRGERVADDVVRHARGPAPRRAGAAAGTSGAPSARSTSITSMPAALERAATSARGRAVGERGRRSA